MSTKKSEKTFNDFLFDFQTRLQGVANDLGDKLARLISTTDADVLKLIVKELPRREKNVRAEIRRLERLIKKIEKTRAPGFELGRDLVFQTARDVAELSSEQTVSEAAAARNEADFAVKKPRAKTLSSTAFANVVDFQPIEGASIATWYSALQRKDLERIANVVTRAAVEGLTVSKIAREIRGSKENGYTDGILQTTRNGAVALARTVINGVSNNARIETIKENADAIDGARFVGTLDGKTCPHCGALDGTVWGPDKLDQIRRPPLHVSCRCCVVPHVVLKGPDGKVHEIGSRPAANADFDALAKEAYNKAAREKGIKRRWDDLAPSTRLKYYYKAQKDFEARTGKPAYRQVSPSTTFAEYFERQDDAFKRSWLGAKRYEAYRNGAKFGDLVKPAATYRATTAELPQTPGNGPISPPNASETPTLKTSAPSATETLAPWEGPDELARLRGKKRVDPATLPPLDGSRKQVFWVRDRIRADQVDAFNAVDFLEYLKSRIDGASDDEEEARRLALVRAVMKERGDAVVLAELEEAAQEIAEKMFAEPSCRVWIDGRFGPGVLHRSTTEALRRVATTGSAAKPKPAFELPPLDLPELVFPRLEGTARQQAWAEDLRRRAFRDWTEERSNETARDALAKIRATTKDGDALTEFEAAIKAVGGDDAAEIVLGREIYLETRGVFEEFRKARDWIEIKTSGKTLYYWPEIFVFGTPANAPKNAAAILRRYAADAKKRNGIDAAKAGNVGVRLSGGEIAENLTKPQDLRFAAGYVEQPTAQKAAKFIKKKLGIVADYSDFNLATANAMNLELIRARNIFGTCGDVASVKSDEKTLRSLHALGGFDNDKKTILLLPGKGVLSYGLDVGELHAIGYYSTDARNHVFRHEIGHALLKGIETSSATTYNRVMDEIRKLRERETLKGTGAANLSEYGMENTREFIAESVAEVMNGNARPLARQVVKILFEW